MIANEETVENLAIECLTCSYCSAQPGDLCRTKSGTLTKSHSARTDLLWRLYGLGYVEARNDLSLAYKKSPDAVLFLLEHLSDESMRSTT